MRHEAASRLEIQVRQVEANSLAGFYNRFSNQFDIRFNLWLWQLILVIGHAPTAAGREMPLARKSDLFCKPKR